MFCCCAVAACDAVSYTHLQTGSIHDLVLIRFADVLLMQSELEEDVSGINRVRSRAGLEPVSYTHLDVYKRQAIY